MQAVHADYIHQRGVTYMQAETSSQQNKQMEQLMQEGDDLGYARLALNLIEALEGGQPRQLIVNIPNQGTISGMSAIGCGRNSRLDQQRSASSRLRLVKSPTIVWD